MPFDQSTFDLVQVLHQLLQVLSWLLLVFCFTNLVVGRFAATIASLVMALATGMMASILPSIVPPEGPTEVIDHNASEKALITRQAGSASPADPHPGETTTETDPPYDACSGKTGMHYAPTENGEMKIINCD